MCLKEQDFSHKFIDLGHATFKDALVFKVLS